MRIDLFQPMRRGGLVLALLSASAVGWVHAANEPAVVPRPMSVELGRGAPRLNANSVIRDSLPSVI